MPDIGAAELMHLQQGMSDQQKMIFMSQYNSERKDRTIALILSVLLGGLGVDWIGFGILKLLTFGGCLIVYLIDLFLDLFLIMGRVDEYNRNKAREIAAAIRASP